MPLRRFAASPLRHERRGVLIALALGLGGCVDLPGARVCGAPDCETTPAHDYRLCAVVPGTGAAGPAGICAPLKGAGATCVADPCHVDVGVHGLCDYGLRCTGNPGICEGGKGYVWDLCDTDDDCTSGLQCWPWRLDEDGVVITAMDHPDRPASCDLFSPAQPAMQDWLTFFGTPTGHTEEDVVASNGLCMAKPIDGQACAVGCLDCADGLDCVAGVCTRTCATSDDCPCLGPSVAGTCQGGACNACLPSKVPLAACPGTLGRPCCRGTGTGTTGEGHSCNTVTGPTGDPQAMCCVSNGSTCTDSSDCCVGSACLGSPGGGPLTCTPCTQTGQALAPGSVCCDPNATVGPDPLIGTGTYCNADCDLTRAGEPCGTVCGDNEFGFPTRDLRVCTREGLRCVRRDSNAAREASTAPGPIQFPSALVFPMPEEWAGQTDDDECNGLDDDCDGRGADDDYDGVECMGTPSGCGASDGPYGGLFRGTTQCVAGAEVCVFDTGTTTGLGDYCAWGSAFSSEERCVLVDGESLCGDDSGIGQACSTSAHAGRVAVASGDRCPPSHACVCRARSGTPMTHDWLCTPRLDSCAFCWDPTVHVDVRDLPSGHQALACPFQWPFP